MTHWHIKWHQMTHRSLRNDASQLRIYSSCWFKRPHETNAGRVSDHEILERSIREWILGDTFWVCTDGLFWRVQKFRTLIPVHSHDRLWHSDKVKWWNHQHQSFWLTRSWQALVGIMLICAWTLPKLTELLRFERQYKLMPHCECNRHEKSVCQNPYDSDVDFWSIESDSDFRGTAPQPRQRVNLQLGLMSLNITCSALDRVFFED